MAKKKRRKKGSKKGRKATPAQLKALKKARAALKRGGHKKKRGRKKGSKKSKAKTHILSGKYKLVGTLHKA